MQKTSFKISGSSLLPSYLRFFDKKWRKPIKNGQASWRISRHKQVQLNYQKLTFYKIVTVQSGFGFSFEANDFPLLTGVKMISSRLSAAKISGFSQDSERSLKAVPFASRKGPQKLINSIFFWTPSLEWEAVLKMYTTVLHVRRRNSHEKFDWETMEAWNPKG